ncbi:MAG: helix-turn-helix transcriptional regulator [Oscillospiraceae bacterium]|nr:helix-turn-helix transcriptional regulator [Oscillospiraceae bacterium]
MKQNNSNIVRMPVLREKLLEQQGDDMSATDFADKLGLSRQTVGFYLSGKRIPDSETLAQICKRCNVSADYLLGLSDDPNIKSPTIDQLGLSPGAVKQLSLLSHSEQADSIMRGLNMLIEDVGILFLAAEFSALCDKINEALDINHQYKDVHSPDDNDDYYKFVVARDYEIIEKTLEKTIVSEFPKMKNDFDLIVGSRMIEYRKRAIVDRFDEIIRRLSNYQEFIDSTLQQRDIMK